MGFSLTRKRVVLRLSDAGADDEWLRWIPAVSANARLTLTSMLPSLFLKSLWYAGSQDDLVTNFCSLTWGGGLARLSQRMVVALHGTLSTEA